MMSENKELPGFSPERLRECYLNAKRERNLGNMVTFVGLLPQTVDRSQYYDGIAGLLLELMKGQRPAVPREEQYAMADALRNYGTTSCGPGQQPHPGRGD